MRFDTQAALLQALIKGAGHGQELRERVKTATGGKVVFSSGQLYPALRKMEDEGLVNATEVAPEADRGGLPRIVYRLTAKGAKAAMDQRVALSGLLSLIPEAG